MAEYIHPSQRQTTSCETAIERSQQMIELSRRLLAAYYQKREDEMLASVSRQMSWPQVNKTLAAHLEAS